MAAGSWRPVPARGAATPCVLFVDGVRRIEARVWFVVDGGGADPGMAASYAAGVVRCDGAATVERVVIERGLFSASPAATDIRTPCGEVFKARMTAGAEVEVLSAAMQERMRAVEIAVAKAERRDDDLLVVDGPLRGRENLPRAMGYIKTHQKTYLPPPQQSVVAGLAAGERTPFSPLAAPGAGTRGTYACPARPLTRGPA